MYSPQEHTLTTGREPVAAARAPTTSTREQAHTPATVRRNQGRRTTGGRMGLRWGMGFISARLSASFSCRASSTLERISSTSTVMKSRVDTALISGLTRFLVMP